MTPRRPPGVQLPPTWKQDYLVALRRSGLHYLAAEAAGVSPRTPQREREIDPAFDEACATARETKLDALEDKLEQLADKTGNPLGIFGRLKAGRPETWVEKNQQLIVNVDLSPPPDQAREVLAGLLNRLTPATRTLVVQPPSQPVSENVGEAGRAIHASPAPSQESPTPDPQ